MKLKLPIIGEIELEETSFSDYKYESDFCGIDLGAIKIDVDFHLDDVKDLDVVKKTILNHEKLIRELTTTYKLDFKNNGITYEFVSEWIDMLEEAEKNQFRAEDIDLQESILAGLRLVRIGIYKNKLATKIVFDFTLGYEDDKGYREHMLVIKTDEKYEITEITTEG